MKNLNFSMKTMAIAGAAFLVLSFGSIFVQNSMNVKAQKMATLSNGVGTCFTRINQSFTALMIQDFSSSYLQPNFMSASQECFNVANKQFNLLWGKAFKDGYKYINQIVSDLHWFNEKTQKLKKLVQEGGVSLTNSNIINKYTGLETAKTGFTDSIEKKQETAKAWATTWFVFSFVGFAGFIAVAGLFGVQQKNNRKLFSDIEDDAAASEASAAKVDRILENVFAKLEMPNTYKFVNEYYSTLLEQQYANFESSDEETQVEVKEKPKAVEVTADFQEAMNSVLDNIQTKAFTHGIMLDADLDDDFNVKGDQEALAQFLYNLIDYATENSLHHNEGRRVSLRSKPLGGTAYLKVAIANYCFNVDELSYLNTADAESSSVNMNLVLIKELLGDIKATIAVKNKMSAKENIEGCEIEVIFQRYKEETTEKSITAVVKGTKREILQAMQSEA